jgi:hypothetical protein
VGLPRKDEPRLCGVFLWQNYGDKVGAYEGGVVTLRGISEGYTDGLGTYVGCGGSGVGDTSFKQAREYWNRSELSTFPFLTRSARAFIVGVQIDDACMQ